MSLPEETTKTIVLDEAATIQKDQPTDDSVNSPPKQCVEPTAFLFAGQTIGGLEYLQKAEKYLLVFYHLNELDSHKFVHNLNEKQIDAQLRLIDLLKFPWGRLPECVFLEIFSRFAFTRIVYFCAHFHVHLPDLEEKSKDKMILNLWNHFSMHVSK